MRALTHDRYGSADVLEIRDVPTPKPGRDEVLVRVEATSINMLDWHMLTGLPRFMRLLVGLTKPKRTIPGADIAGVIESLGDDVDGDALGVTVGDAVFGGAPGGGCAEYVVAAADRVITRPTGATADESACLGVAAVTALQGLRDKGKVQQGDRVLIIGASGGVGTFAVQVAKHLGATVTAVCSTSNVEQARSLGADTVIDYRSDDFVALAREQGVRYDVIFDNPGHRSLGDLRSILAADGRYVMVGGPKGKWIAPLPRILAGTIRWMFVGQRFVTFTAQETREALIDLREMFEAGAVRSVISDRYTLDAAADAIRQQGDGHSRAKIVVTPN